MTLLNESVFGSSQNRLQAFKEVDKNMMKKNKEQYTVTTISTVALKISFYYYAAGGPVRSAAEVLPRQLTRNITPRR